MVPISRWTEVDTGAGNVPDLVVNGPNRASRQNQSVSQVILPRTSNFRRAAGIVVLCRSVLTSTGRSRTVQAPHLERSANNATYHMHVEGCIASIGCSVPFPKTIITIKETGSIATLRCICMLLACVCAIAGSSGHHQLCQWLGRAMWVLHD